MANIIQNITEISKIVGCDESFYHKQNYNIDPYYESTIYLVNNGVSINKESKIDKEDDNERIAYTDLYYGSRKLTDALVINEDGNPDQPDYPNDKMYLKPTVEVITNDEGEIVEKRIVGYRVYYKHDDFVIPIATTDQLILVDEVENNPAVLKMTLTIKGKQVKANVLCVDDKEGELALPADIYDALYNKLKTDITNDLKLTWISMESTQ